jgi:hypothetical protein
VAFIASLSFDGTLPLLPGQAPSASVAQQLRSQYRLSPVSSDTVSLVRAGSVLAVAENGIKASPPSAFGCWYNSHKPGNGIKYSTVSEALTPADLKTQMRLLQVGEKVVVIRLDVKPSEVGFCVQTYSDNPNDPPYRAAILFQFPQKNFVQPANLKAIQDSIAEVFTLNDTSPTESAVPAPQLEQIAGRYVMTQAPDNHIQLNADGTLSLVQGGRNYSGTFTMEGDKLVGRIGNGAPQQEGSIQGDTLIDPNGSTWVKQGAAPAVAATAVAPLRLPSTYVSAQTPADQIQLNADSSFSLQEAGQTYRGTFAANGNALELNINGGPKSTATIQGNSLTDSGGLTWVLREQPAAGAAAESAAAPTVAPVRLPSIYVSAQTPANQIQLNADNSFSLQEAGQTYRGTFAANGDTLELNISGGPKSTATIQGNSLTDSGGQTWVLRGQPAGTAPSGDLSKKPAPVASESPVSAPIPATAGSTRGPAGPESDIEAGKEVAFPIKYASQAPSVRRTSGFYTSGPGGLVVGMADGVLTLSKTTFAFRGPCLVNRGFGRYDHCDFRVSPGKILELENQPEQSSRIHVKVAIKNAKGDKEDKKDYYFYNVGAQEVGDGAVGGPGTSIICDGCDDSMDVLYGLLTKIRAQ